MEALTHKSYAPAEVGCERLFDLLTLRWQEGNEWLGGTGTNLCPPDHQVLARCFALSISLVLREISAPQGVQLSNSPKDMQPGRGGAGI